MTVACWLQTSLQRVYPTSPAGDQCTLSFVRPQSPRVVPGLPGQPRPWHSMSVARSRGPPGCDVLVRRIGYVPQWHATIDTPTEELDGVGLVPGLVPDPRIRKRQRHIGPRENQSFWVTITVPAKAQPGVREPRHTVRAAEWHTAGGTARDAGHPVPGGATAARFPVTHWWRPETIYEHYAIEPFGEAWWKLAEAYIRNLVAHGNNVLFVQQLFPRREFVRRPAQMVKITCPSPGQYEFEWSDVRRLVRLGRECGATHFEWSHLWIYWGVQHAMPVYTMKDGQAVPLWPPDTDGHGELYTNFLRQFLPSFHQFLQEENLLKP